MTDWPARFPELFATTRLPWPGVDTSHLRLRFSLDLPPQHLVGNVRVVARTPGGVLVCGSDLGWRFLPGGTREPGESVEETGARELREEAGAVLTGPLTAWAAFEVTSSAAHPYRPHLPHPVVWWLYAVADVEVVGPPTNPSDGEQVTSVQAMPAAEAAGYLEGYDPVMAGVLRLATALGLTGGERP